MRLSVLLAITWLASCGLGSTPSTDSAQLLGQPTGFATLYDEDEAQSSELELQSLNLLEDRNAIKPAANKIAALQEFITKKRYSGWPADQAPRSNNRRMTGPEFMGDSYSTHARVRIFYSLGVFEWLVRRESNPEDPDNVLPDGSMIIKEMYPPSVPTSLDDPDEISGWAVMVRDSKVSTDGWLWYLYYLPHNKTNGKEFELAQYGMSFCVSCHASTTNVEGTFSALGNITGDDVVAYVNVPASPIATDAPNAEPGGHTPPASRQAALECLGPDELSLIECLSYNPITEPLGTPDPGLLKQYGLSTPKTPVAMPPDIIYDHIVMGPDNKSGFVTADQCEGCHDATNQLKASMTHMIVPTEKKYGFERFNLSQMGEWTGSLMGRSSRDPVFRAQAEYEVNAAPAEEADETLRTCMRCHAPMGQRQLHLDHGENATLTLEMLDAVPHSKGEENALYGSLGRDGVSCSICHRITEQNLGSHDSFTGKFELGPPNEIYGPYKDVNTRLMERGLDLTPKLGEQIASSKLCGSCHTVQLPVFGSEPAKEVFEQTTYFEWQNSKYSRPASEPTASCVACHMPNTNPLDGSRLSYKIANFEDDTFPYVPNRMTAEELSMTERGDFRRHTLVGVNRFVQAMFSQFPRLLGSSTFEPNRSATTYPSQILTQISTAELARKETASVSVVAEKTDSRIEAQIEITNKAGHKLPTGVGFRRAFLEISLLGASGTQIWCSGCTDRLGLILGANGQPLPSEYDDANAYEPDRSIIANADDVQIFETRHTNCDNTLTTSFMRLCHEVKDNRILPAGWSIDGEYAQETEPQGVLKPYTPGTDTVRLSLPMNVAPNAREIQVRLIYQATPPYYLRDRFELLDKTDAPNTQRLAYLASHLDVAKEKDFTSPDLRSDIADWKLTLTQDKVSITSGKASTTTTGGS